MRPTDKKLPPPQFVWARPGAKPTKRTHYNPTFWTALWNPEYFESPQGMVAREQSVHVLRLPADKVFRDTVENVHFSKGLGLTSVDAAVFGDWAKSASASNLDNGLANLRPDSEVQIELEQFFCALERGPEYKATFDLIKSEEMQTREQKAFVAGFLLTQVYRHPKSVAAMVARYTREGREDWQAMLEMRDLWSPGQHAPKIAKLALAHWTLHTATVHTFPLPDDPVLVNDARNRVWAVISPRMLLEIALDRPVILPCTKRAFSIGRDKSIYKNFRRLAIRQATNEVLFHDEMVLEEWRTSPEFRERLRIIRPDGQSSL